MYHEEHPLHVQNSWKSINILQKYIAMCRKRDMSKFLTYIWRIKDVAVAKKYSIDE